MGLLTSGFHRGSRVVDKFANSAFASRPGIFHAIREVVNLMLSCLPRILGEITDLIRACLQGSLRVVDEIADLTRAAHERIVNVI